MSALRITQRLQPPRELLAPPTLGGLLRMALADWAGIAACWALMAVTPPAVRWVAWPLPMLLIAGRLQALGVVLHDAVHMRRPPAPSWRLMFLQVLAAYPIVTTLRAMRYHHLRHHRHPCTALDPYFKPGASHRVHLAVLQRLRGLVVVPAWALRPVVGLLALRWPTLRNAYGRVLLGDKSGADLQGSAELLHCLRAEAGQAAFFIAVALLAWRWPLAVGVGYALPLLIAGVFNAHRVVAEHVHVPLADHRPASVAAGTRDHLCTGLFGVIQRALLYPRHIGYHTMHHLHPGAALGQLPALQAWYARELLKS
ncbi:fatty acid desaturase [Ottowia testudinis]|uniref:Fatty acid desaturase n=1 Tax=Ottowia testudinis TaxID=2816950 RepID=A0A975CHN8_9BURK|nr:fatty acid desaturase [Ottowia testudinis]QTD45774.1 fatty acid desaturase [Ottowia testudinis]